jgi:hypothetical protein
LVDIEEKDLAPDEFEAEGPRRKANKRKTMARFSTRSYAGLLTKFKQLAN